MILMVTKDEMIATARSRVVGTSMVTVELDSPMDGKMNKGGNPFYGQGIVKRETLNGTIGYIYANAVNRIAAKEGKEERQAKRHPWGDMDKKHLFRVHRKNGNCYLSMQVKNITVHGFFAPDGTEIDSDSIQAFVPVKAKSSTQQDLDGEVIAKDYSMDNIKVIRAFGDTFYIIENLTEQERIDAETTAAQEATQEQHAFDASPLSELIG